MKIFNKESTAQISKNLNQLEVRCHCNSFACAYTLIHTSVINSFEQLRSLCNDRVLYLSSAFRCIYHNSRVKIGGKRLSKHVIGYALDIICPKDMDIYEFAKLAEDCFDKVIVYEKSGFIHCQNEPVNQGEFI